MSSDTFELNCIVGKDVNKIFTVRVAKSKNVTALKDQIKAHQLQLQVVQDFDLYHVAISSEDEDFEEKLANLKLTERKPLFLMKRISAIFTNPPVQSDLHIIVKPEPQSTCIYSCLSLSRRLLSLRTPSQLLSSERRHRSHFRGRNGFIG